MRGTRKLRETRRHGRAQEKGPTQSDLRMEAEVLEMDECCARTGAALDMLISAMKNGGDWEVAFKAYVSLV